MHIIPYIHYAHTTIDWEKRGQNGKFIRKTFIRNVGGCDKCLINSSIFEGKGVINREKARFRLCFDCEDKRISNDQLVVKFKNHLYHLMLSMNIFQQYDDQIKRNKNKNKNRNRNNNKNNHNNHNYNKKFSIIENTLNFCLNKLNSLVILQNWAPLRELVKDTKNPIEKLAIITYEFLQQNGIKDRFFHDSLFLTECAKLNECDRGDNCSYCHYSQSNSQTGFDYRYEFDMAFGRALRYLLHTEKNTREYKKYEIIEQRVKEAKKQYKIKMKQGK